MADDIDHPDHYGGDEPYEVIKVLEAWDLNLAKGFCWGNLIKYTARATRKDCELSDRQKAAWYAERLTAITAQLAGQGMTREAEGTAYAFGGAGEPTPGDFVNAVLKDEPLVPKFAPGDWLTDRDDDRWNYGLHGWHIELQRDNPDFSFSFDRLCRMYGPLTIRSGFHEGKVFDA
jgi:hypothetical protein